MNDVPDTSGPTTPISMGTSGSASQVVPASGLEALAVPAGAPLAEVLRQATARLAAAGVATPRADATTLLAHVVEVDTGELARLAILGRRLAPEVAPRFAALMDRRCEREPLQHLTGRAPFRGIELAVGPGVFVPRPETEVVAGHAIDELTRVRATGRSETTAVDLCTGSGAIALAIADEVPGVRVVAVEFSDDALIWARQNVEARRPVTGGGVELVRADVTTDLPQLGDLRGRVDVVVSNPPYIPPDAVPVDVEVARHDPHAALYGLGEDGLQVPRAVAERAADLLRPDGLFVMEHADVQSDAMVAHLAADPRWTEVAAHEDLTGRPRYVSARRATVPCRGF